MPPANPGPVVRTEHGPLAVRTGSLRAELTLFLAKVGERDGSIEERLCQKEAQLDERTRSCSGCVC